MKRAVPAPDGRVVRSERNRKPESGFGQAKMNRRTPRCLAWLKPCPSLRLCRHRADEGLELGAHRQVDARSGGQPVQEPALVFALDFAVLCEVAEGVVDQAGQLHIALAVQDAVRIVGQELADDQVFSLGLVLRDQAVQQHVVGCKDVGLAACDLSERLGVVARHQQAVMQLEFPGDVPHGLLVGGAGRDHHRFAREIAEGLDGRAALYQELGARHEDGRGETDPLLALEVVGGGPALQVGLSRDNGVDARLRGYRQPFDFQLAADRLADRIDQPSAQLDRVADRLAARRQVGEGNGRLAVGEGDGTAGAGLEQRPGELDGRLSLRKGHAAREGGPGCKKACGRKLHGGGPRQAGAAGRAASSSSAYSSAWSGGRSSPSHLATTAVAIELPIALVAERPMSRKVSTPRISSSPASGMLNWLSVAAITTSEARGTPAIPLEVSIRISSIVICVPSDSSTL